MVDMGHGLLYFVCRADLRVFAHHRLFRKYALYLLGVDLLVVSFGHGLLEPIWDLQHVIPRAVLLIFILVAPGEWDRWSLDGVVFGERVA